MSNYANLIGAAATLIAELSSAGYDISAILREARKTGKISDETWDNIRQEVERAEELWEKGA
jgi:predicted transcriptional regulator